MATNTQTAQKNGNLFAIIVIPVLFVVAIIIWQFVLGAAGNFEDAEREHPKVGNLMAMMFKGGVLVPVLITLFLTVLTFVIERFITIFRASGSGSVDTFVRNIQQMLNRGDINAALAACDKQKGSVANVVRSGLDRFHI